MEYRPLGRTGVQVSAISVGGWQFGVRTTPEESERIMNTALDAGINFFDTSNVYGGGRGRSEEIIGGVLQASGQRDRVVMATKVYFPADPTDPNGRGVSRRHIIQQCEQSLRSLNTDYIDLYYMHRLDPDIPVDEPLRAADDLIRSGKVRYIGTSTTSAWQFVESLWVAKELGLNRFVAETPPYSIVDRRVERELIPMAQTFGVAVNPWAPMGGSLLTGSYKRGEAPPPGSRMADPDQNMADRYASRMNERVYDVIEAVGRIAERHGCSSAAAAFAWVMRQPGVTSPIAGAEKVSDVTDTLTALDVQLTEEDLAEIDAVAEPASGISPFYVSDQNQFRMHRHRVL